MGKVYGLVIVMPNVVPDATNGPCVTPLQLGTLVAIFVGVEEGVNVSVGGGVKVLVGVRLGVKEMTGVSVTVGVFVRVGVELGVGVGDGVNVGV